MLGDLLVEESGSVTLQRVLTPENGLPRIEISFEAEGTGVGIDYNHRATYLATMRPDGTIWGEGDGVMVGVNGDVVTWHGGGVGHMAQRPEGGFAVAYRGAIYYSSASGGALGALNGKVGVFEYDIDSSNRTAARVYEWR